MKVSDIDSMEQKGYMVPTEVQGQIKIADSYSIFSKTERERRDWECMKRAFRIVLRYEEELK